MNKDTYNFIRWMNKHNSDKKYNSYFEYFYSELSYSDIKKNIFQYEKEKNIIIDCFDENGISVKKNNDEKIIYFDVDGTFYDLYNYPNWLECILSENTQCYTQSKLLVDETSFITVLIALKEKGYKLGIITWLSKNATKNYQNKVRKAKYRYIKNHFSNLFDEIHILQYGKDKSVFCKGKNTILFDDEENNRIAWKQKNGIAYNVNNLINTLQNIESMIE